MVSDIDIWRTANLTIKQHGDLAVAFAQTRAADLAGKGDREGWAVWKQIERVIGELQDMELPDDREGSH